MKKLSRFVYTTLGLGRSIYWWMAFGIWIRSAPDATPTADEPAEFTPAQSLADYIRSCLQDKFGDTLEVPFGYYTMLANAIGATPTYVSVVAGRAGYKVVRLDD